MKNRNVHGLNSSLLRQRAEDLLNRNPSVAGSQFNENDVYRLIHELEVHQIELEMQNDELRLAKEREAELASEKYIELYDFAPSGYFTLSREGKIIGLNLSGAKMLGKDRSHLKNSRFGFFVTQEALPIFNLFLEKVFISKSKETCELSLSAINDFPTCIHLTGVLSENGEYCYATVLDISERRRVEETLKESEHLYRSLFGNMLNGFAYCQMIFDEDENPVDFIYLAVNNAFETLTGLADVIGKKISEVIPGIRRTDPELFEIYGRVSKNGQPERFEYFLTALPMWLSVSVYCPGYSFFVTVFEVITEQKKAEAEKLKSEEIREQLLKHLTEIRENERAVISREIHDQLGQSMTAIKLDLNWLQGNVTANPGIQVKLAGMVDLITETIGNVQRISSELRPGILDDLGLAAAIEWYCEEFEKRTHLNVIMNLDEVQTQSNQRNLALFRVLQEALTNVIRHAQAKTVGIVLSETNQHIILEIIDDGIGIPLEKIKPIRSLGLMGMQERVLQADGTLEISGGDVSGTKIRICVPVES